MKKLILMMAAIAFIANGSNAQGTSSDTRDQIQFGAKIGANLSNVYDSQGQDFVADSKIGVAGGVFLALPIGKYIGIQPELLFSQKGFKGSGTILGSSYSFTRTTSYIDIPILLAIKPIPMLTILVGPQYSYLLKQKDSFDNAILSGSQEQQFDNDNIRKNTLCATGGVDINLNPIVIGARVGWDFQQNNGDGTSTTPRYKNMWYQLTIGFKL
jgi:hypothetical protein